MKKKLLIGGGAIASAAFAAAVAFAAPDAMGKADTDGDGAISKAEVTAIASANFAKMDINKDGKLDAADREAKHKAHFDALDADKNGSISEAEFTAARQERMEKRGKPGEGHMGMDHKRMQGHGKRGGHQLLRGLMMLKMADANGDKAVTQAEMTALIDTHFAKADTNNDGKISNAEHVAARKAMHERMLSAAAK